MSLADRVLSEARGDGPDLSQARRAAIKAMKGIRPRGNRPAVVKLIGAALAKSPIVMDWLYPSFKEGESVSWLLGNLIGDYMYNWKADWELDGPEWEELSLDRELAAVMGQALKGYTMKGVQRDKDWFQVWLKSRALERVVKALDQGGSQVFADPLLRGLGSRSSRKELQTRARQLAIELAKELK